MKTEPSVGGCMGTSVPLPIHSDPHDHDDPSAVYFLCDGQQMRACAGQTIAAALLANGRRSWRNTPRNGEPRGLFCGMGVCFDCLIQVDGRSNVRACRAPVKAGLHVETQIGQGTWKPAP
jgi:predicted molibdopterin-dependent oxidoreductase YjgC